MINITTIINFNYIAQQYLNISKTIYTKCISNLTYVNQKGKADSGIKEKGNEAGRHSFQAEDFPARGLVF